MEAIVELLLEVLILQQSPEKQRCSPICRPNLIAFTHGVVKGIERYPLQTSVAIKEYPTPLAIAFLPATHIVGGPVDVSEKSSNI